MRLAIKLVCLLVLVNVALAAVFGYISVQRQVDQFELATRDEAERLGQALESLLVDAWQRAGDQGLQGVVGKATTDEREMRIRWVWFDSQPGTRYAPSARIEQLTTITIQQHQTVQVLDPNGESRLNVYWPVALKAQHPGGLEFSRATFDLDAAKREIILRSVLLITSMLALSGLLAAILGVRLIGRPLRQLSEKTRRVACGDLSGPIDLHSHDELTELAESLNRMCRQLGESQIKIREETAARIATLEQLRHADRLNTVGRLAAGIAHEMGTPLNVISGRAGLIASGRLPPEDINTSAAAIKAETEKMTRIIRQLLDFARCSSSNRTQVDLRQVVRQTVDLLTTLSEKQHIQLAFDGGMGPAFSAVDSAQIQQVVTNLVMNAIQAMPHEGKIDITLRRQTLRPPNAGPEHARTYHCLEVRDEGVGIPEENLQHVFEPFFTTKEVGEGTGLGLAIAFGIVQEHGGWIDVASEPGKGTAFTVFLPEGTQS